MENEYREKIEKVGFLFDKKAPLLFAKIDYYLRSGGHIQREYPLPSELYRFLSKHYDSLKYYYSNFFDLTLCKDGSEFNQYFFLDLSFGGRSKIGSDYREYLKSEHIIVGLLFFKMHMIDGNIELESVKDFIAMLFNEYEEEKVALRKLITDSDSITGSDRNDTKVEAVIEKAFDKFGELGWLIWDNSKEKDKFKILPSFERLRQMYIPQIQNIDELLKQSEDAK